MLNEITSTAWGQAAIGVAAFIAFALPWYYLMRSFRSWLKRNLDRTPVRTLEPLLKRSLALLQVWGLLASASFAAELASVLPSTMVGPVRIALFGVLVILLGSAATEGVVRLVGHSLKTAQTPLPLIKFSQVVALVSFSYLTLLILLAVIDVSITPLLGLGAVAAIPLLLVLQAAASDLFFYFRLMRRQHLRVGDVVRLENGVAGQVVSITWQDVRIRTKANNLAVIPNRQMAKLIVTNFHLPSGRTSLNIPVHVTQGPSPEIIQSILSDEVRLAARDLPGLAPNAPPEVKGLSTKSGVGNSFLVLCEVADAALVDVVERELLHRIARRFRKEEIRSPLLDLYDEEPTTSLTPSSQELRSIVEGKLKGTVFVVASNREPYIHTFEGQSIRWDSPASGMTTALDPVMRVLGGVWVAAASGNADREVSDAKGSVPVPPDRPAYTLRRLWLTKKQEDGYYHGFSNKALWPLCHTVYVRPAFSVTEWETYREVNRLFAEAILEEIRGKKAFVFLQDYHLALVPRLLKDAGASVAVAHFWHIPWPTSEVFQTCPWGEEILQGLLGNDLLGFHTRYHCNNFLSTVDKVLESRVDYGSYSVTRQGHQTLVRPFPVSIDFEAISQGVASPPVQRERQRLMGQLGFRRGPIGLGVDRLDYTKGIPERLKAIDRFLDVHPEYKGRFTFIQVGVPSRSQIKEYQEADDEIQHLVDEINWRHRTDSWEPVIYFRKYFSHIPLWALYSMADFCIVSSLHDGMNLVAKEYVSARTDDTGVLLLSRFTGAAGELADALLVNPYDTEQFARAIAEALNMPRSEQSRRMQRMRTYLRDNDIYRWATRVLTELSRLETAVPEPLLPEVRQEKQA